MPAKTLLRAATVATMIATAGIATAGIATAGTAPAADLAIVLLTDVSASMDDDEFAMVKQGYLAAFGDPDVVAALAANPGGVAVAYVEFSGGGEIATVAGWSLLTDAASAGAFGLAVATAPRSSAGNTALAAGLRHAAAMLSEGGFGGARRIIDVVSDHEGDGGRSAPVRDAAVAAGITINALPIADGRPRGTFDGRLTYSGAPWGLGGMTAFYQRDVVGGPGSFLISARDHRAFGEALKRKLLRELMARDAEPRRGAASAASVVAAAGPCCGERAAAATVGRGSAWE
ncbi:DUF1194 domain-containing protein [Azospirillum sp. ST 5-10]|uniref:DUF1194 domain-containing protein n=1 Tax=unclassified Azospirillum TaxID=2630922 RepID=UPI003F4A116C